MGKTKDILDNLPDFFQVEEDSNNYKFISSFDEDFQEVSDNIENLKSAIQVTTASGLDLDTIGSLFKLIRKGDETDSDFRSRILAFWQGFAQGGTETAILDTLKAMTGLSDDDITLTEIDTLKIKITANIGSLGASTDVVIDTLNEVKAAGVYLILNFQSSLSDTYEHTDSVNINLASSIYITPDISEPDSSDVPL